MKRQRRAGPATTSTPRARYGSGHERRVVARQGREQHVALHLAGERMEGEQRVDALEIGAGGEEHRRAAARRRRLAAGEHDQQTSGTRQATSTAKGIGPRRREARAAGAASETGGDCTHALARPPRAHRPRRRARRRDADVLPAPPRAGRPGAAARRAQRPRPSRWRPSAQALGLDRPVAAQYAAWLGRFVRGDWGTSIATGRPVRGDAGAGLAGHRRGWWASRWC